MFSHNRAGSPPAPEPPVIKTFSFGACSPSHA
uniref:Uncharacterized protein n=1 Tax=Anguilla anguilla TaxID=7936 RepID=A0A0E9PU68_ANGAN